MFEGLGAADVALETVIFPLTPVVRVPPISDVTSSVDVIDAVAFGDPVKLADMPDIVPVAIELAEKSESNRVGVASSPVIRLFEPVRVTTSWDDS